MGFAKVSLSGGNWQELIPQPRLIFVRSKQLLLIARGGEPPGEEAVGQVEA